MTATDTQPEHKLEISTSRGFPDWLAQQGASLAFSTYQAGKLFLTGSGRENRLSIFERSFSRSMGLAVSQDTQRLWLATLNQVYRFDNTVPDGGHYQDHDALYVPRMSWISGDLDIHDITLDKEGAPVFVNTLFNCLAKLEDGHSFKPVWKPPFISRLAAEDRCHLNGLASEGGVPRYATAAGRSDVVDGWRDQRCDGGMVLDVASGEAVCEGLSMPHSPRLHNNRLWLLNSGTGEFGYCDLTSGVFEPVAFCPGYARGLSFIGDIAVIGLSLSRGNRTVEDLPLKERLKDRGASPRCGLLFVDTNTGNALHWLRIEGVVTELYDVAVLPGVRRPALIGFKGDEINHIISVAL